MKMKNILFVAVFVVMTIMIIVGWVSQYFIHLGHEWVREPMIITLGVCGASVLILVVAGAVLHIENVEGKP